jgi:hypothetical protein
MAEFDEIPLGPVSQKAANYTPTSPEPRRQCGLCQNFDIPNKCHAVEGAIVPEGSCDLWQAVEGDMSPPGSASAAGGGPAGYPLDTDARASSIFGG